MFQDIQSDKVRQRNALNIEKNVMPLGSFTDIITRSYPDKPYIRIILLTLF
jgi:hypothetical protein